jgi:alpha-L-rhamnosidase
VSQWYYYHDTLLLSQIAKVLGKSEDTDTYRAQAERIKTAFNRKFLHDTQYGGAPDRWYQRLIPRIATAEERRVIDQHLAGQFAVRSQTGDVLALFLDLVPDDKKEAVLQGLVNDIVVIHGTHVNTGIVGTRYILDVLSDNGYADLAFKLVTQTTYPSWGYMVKEGATTLWERWEYLTDVGMNSQNHIMLGSVDTWFYRYLAGIQLDSSVPGWQKIVIKPHILGDLTFVSASVHTVNGLVSSDWRKKTHDGLELQVTVPVNSRARVSVPTLGLEDVLIRENSVVLWEQGSVRSNNSGITGGHDEGAYVSFEVGSGSYVFAVCERG